VESLRRFARQARDEMDVEPLVIVLRCEQAAAADMREAISAIRSVFSTTHICLACDVDEACHSAIDALRDSQVGLLLDDVDAETPLARLAEHPLEAIRFDRDFALRAGEDLRTSCVLIAMLGLARDLGLCVFGPEIASPFTEAIKFDFTPRSREVKNAERSTASKRHVA